MALALAEKVRFCEEVLSDVTRYGMTYMEAILNVAEKWGIEPESAAAMVDGPMKQHLKSEGKTLNLISRGKGKSVKLPVV